MLKQACFIILLLLSVNIFVLVQDRQEQLSTSIITHPKEWSQQVSTYGRYIEDAVTNAKYELSIYRSKRPSTRCSLDDIVFTAARHLPDWFFPARVWRQDPATRHQKIIQILKAPHIYPYANPILDNATNWTAQTTQLFDAYIEETRLKLEGVYKLSQDYMEIVTKNTDVPAILLDTSSDTLQKSITHYLSTNQHNFTMLLKESNKQFNKIINLSGPLRRPMESIRFDIIQSIKEAKDKQIGHIEIALTELVKHAQSELKNPSTSIDLKDYIIKPIRDELASFYKTNTILDHLKQKVSWILTMGSSEFRHDPSQLSFWVDLLDEMKEADIRLLKSLPKKFPTKKQNSCNA
ncbi:hypothetical protein K501DRAFT_333547 [Backusella circina FSU 941]|nr:hypothetical protein K501DRAFT_333547 [Backusella circina FSU 941]